MLNETTFRAWADEELGTTPPTPADRLEWVVRAARSSMPPPVRRIPRRGYLAMAVTVLSTGLVTGLLVNARVGAGGRNVDHPQDTGQVVTSTSAPPTGTAPRPGSVRTARRSTHPAGSAPAASRPALATPPVRPAEPASPGTAPASGAVPDTVPATTPAATGGAGSGAGPSLVPAPSASPAPPTHQPSATPTPTVPSATPSTPVPSAGGPRPAVPTTRPATTSPAV